MSRRKSSTLRREFVPGPITPLSSTDRFSGESIEEMAHADNGAWMSLSRIFEENFFQTRCLCEEENKQRILSIAASQASRFGMKPKKPFEAEALHPAWRLLLHPILGRIVGNKSLRSPSRDRFFEDILPAPRELRVCSRKNNVYSHALAIAGKARASDRPPPQ